MTRLVATSHDMSEGDAPFEEKVKTESQSNEDADELKQLREQVMSLEIDKRVRDGLLDQMKNDRKELLGQLQGHVETLTKQSREIGQLETRLELSAPAPQQIPDDVNLPTPINPDQPEMHWEGDNEANHHSQYAGRSQD
jgi:chromosome segregation ATPase